MTFKPDPWSDDEEETCCSECGVYITFEDYMDLGLCPDCIRADDEAWQVAVLDREEDEALQYGGAELEDTDD